MSIESSTNSPVAPAVPQLKGGEPPPPFDERALLAHYVLRDFESAVDRVEQELRAADNAEQANKKGAEDDAVAESRRDFARQMVIGAWLNRNNPEWDPQRPETHRPDPKDPLLEILKGLEPSEA
ncbi:MAG: hypothetical protein JF606_04980 [Burkholderiales bacterium]|jgi:hypothetical protein|nr:hypothetical protein [Burkholderiales bacterium]